MDETFVCACCGEINEVFLEPGLDRQEFVQDCAVCCRPMVITARWDPQVEVFVLDARQEDRD